MASCFVYSSMNLCRGHSYNHNNDITFNHCVVNSVQVALLNIRHLKTVGIDTHIENIYTLI